MSELFQNASCAEACTEHRPRLGLRWQAQRDTAFASRGAVPASTQPRSKAPSPLRSAGALHIALLLLLTLSLPAQDSVRTLAGLPETPGSTDGTNTTARFNDPAGIAIAADGTIFVADNQNHAIRRIGTNGVVTTLAGLPGTPGSADGTGSTARFDSPTSLALGPDGALFVSDTGNHTIRRINTDGTVTTFAGFAGMADYTNGPTTTTNCFSLPLGLAVASDGTVFVADSGNHVIRTITSNGIASILAGNPRTFGFADGTGTNAFFNSPVGLALAPDGSLFVSDANNFTLRRVTADGVVTTLAGAAGQDGSADGPAASARFGKPAELALAPNGTLYIADAAHHAIRRLTPDGRVSTIAGLVGADGAADGANGLARFFNPYGLAIAACGHLVVADTYNQTVRELLAPFAVGVSPSGNGRVISWEAVVGRSYQVQFKDSLSAAWQNLGTTTLADSLAASQPDTTVTTSPRFYRILRVE
ncbi:MAG: NHL repeat-containing protein [Limisphaerales bacterium]|nr:MAG: NHL repeat-containing protein [Limisphaerales bacterium]KAG0508909.1 MAG: NHL repeat-containing protein [Limisphaerales bacterium]TXT50251.1 MAG: NHL repeat-containing protein [Limisphaerales bacterium]